MNLKLFLYELYGIIIVNLYQVQIIECNYGALIFLTRTVAFTKHFLELKPNDKEKTDFANSLA